MTSHADKIARFQELHAADELFLMPNPWDIGSARILEHLGFPAIATTSSGHAASLGRLDQQVRRQEFLDHLAAVCGSVDIPVNADSERCFGETPAEITATVQAIIEAGAAGCSIEDYDPTTDSIDELEVAAERVAAAAEAAHAGTRPIVLTARAEGHLYGPTDMDDTIARLVAFRDAGADVVYAPGLARLADIELIIDATGVPVNVLNWPGGPTVQELAGIGVRRVSTGGALAWFAYGGLASAARELLDEGTYSYMTNGLVRADRQALR